MRPMKLREMDRFTAHLSRCFRQEDQDCIVLHPRGPQKPHIDMLLYRPSEGYPFWKLSTMGASDYKLPLTFCQRNEFVMFIHKDADLDNRDTLTWYCDVLLSVALYPAANHLALGFGHSIVWGSQSGTDMTCAYLEQPFPISDPRFSRCRLSFFRQTRCLQVVLLTQEEMNNLFHLGPEKFRDFLAGATAPSHFLSERYRSNRF